MAVIVSVLYDHWYWASLMRSLILTIKSLTRSLILMASLIRSLSLILSLIPSMILIRSLLYGGGVTADDRNYLIRGLIPNVSLLHDHWRWSEISYTTTDTDDKSYTTADTDRKSLTRLLILMTSLIRSLTLILSLIQSMILIRSLLYEGGRLLLMIVIILYEDWYWS
jgi:hypothetical protein